MILQMVHIRDSNVFQINGLGSIVNQDCRAVRGMGGTVLIQLLFLPPPPPPELPPPPQPSLPLQFPVLVIRRVRHALWDQLADGRKVPWLKDPTAKQLQYHPQIQTNHGVPPETVFGTGLTALLMNALLQLLLLFPQLHQAFLQPQLLFLRLLLCNLSD